jgi:hypothetical protein
VEISKVNPGLKTWLGYLLKRLSYQEKRTIKRRGNNIEDGLKEMQH